MEDDLIDDCFANIARRGVDLGVADCIFADGALLGVEPGAG